MANNLVKGVISIIEIDRKKVTNELVNKLRGKHCYADMVPELSEHIYSIPVLSVNTFSQKETKALVRKIQSEGKKSNASYFRISYI
jgi:hypothetical protein